MRQRRWIKLFHEFDFEIIFKPGKENVIADSLSRKAFLNAISMANNPIIERIKEAAKHDFEYTQQMNLASQDPDRKRPADRYYSCHDGCLYYRDRICVPNNINLRKALLFEAHDSPVSGHFGYAKTLNALRRSYHWVGLKGDVLRYVRQCISCQRIKAERVKMPGELQPLDIPQMKWECISMDFVTGLPKTQGGYDSIMVIVDMLTKVVHIIPVKVS